MLSVHRYPEFLVDLVASRLMFACLSTRCNFHIGRSVRVRGLPIVSLAPGSSINIGSGAYLISRSRNTALGVNHPMIMRTMLNNAKILIGDHFHASGVTLCAANAILIGDRVTMGANSIVVDTDFHSLSPAVRSSAEADQHGAQCSPVTIGNDVFIGMNSIILKGVRVGAESVVGAGSVVTKDVPFGAIVAGNPARIIRLSK